MLMDNFSLDVTGRDEPGLRLALELAFLGHGGRAMAWCWREDVYKNQARLVFGHDYCEGKDGWQPFPAPLDVVGAADMAMRWLENADHGREPDHDGDNVRGWRVAVGAWGHVEPYGYGAFASVFPAWAMLGK
jgi:hypothetical protein